MSFACLFGGFRPTHGDVTIAGKRLQILTCARHSMPLSDEASLSCHTYCDTSIHLKNGVYNGDFQLQGPLTLATIAERLALELSHPVCHWSVAFENLTFLYIPLYIHF